MTLNAAEEGKSRTGEGMGGYRGEGGRILRESNGKQAALGARGPASAAPPPFEPLPLLAPGLTSGNCRSHSPAPREHQGRLAAGAGRPSGRVGLGLQRCINVAWGQSQSDDAGWSEACGLTLGNPPCLLRCSF